MHMPGNRFSSAFLCVTVLYVLTLMAEEPALSTEQKLEIREAQVAALESAQLLTEFLARIQAQVEALPEYRKLKAAAEAGAESLAQAVQRVAAACEGCRLDVKTLRLGRREPGSAGAGAAP